MTNLKFKKTCADESFNAGTPLGPEVATNRKTYFDHCVDDDNLLVRSLSKKPNVIIGRRGSGKTTLLLSSGQNYDICANIKQDEVYDAAITFGDQRESEKKEAYHFFEILNGIREITVHEPFVEQISDFWEFLFWLSLMREVLSQRSDSSNQHICYMRDFFTGLGLDINTSPIRMLKFVLTDSQVSCFSNYRGINFIGGDKVKFLQAKLSLETWLEMENMQGIVLLDTLEDFELERADMSRTIAGLLHCVGQFNSSESRASVCLSLPAEIYPAFLKLSFNPLKDFQSSILLHWSAGELIQLAATRYAYYLEKTNPLIFHEKFGALNIHSREGAIQFWHEILPEFVENGLNNRKENPIAYIIRHTQLLPRHVIMLFNSIISEHLSLRGDPFRIDSRIIRKGVQEGEKKVLAEVIRGYRYSCQYSDEILRKYIPGLPLCFTYKEIDERFIRKAKKEYGLFDVNDLLSALAEIGAIGRVVNETEHYIECEFEFMLPGRLIPSTEDTFCIHPIFTEEYRASFKEEEDMKPIYPYNCNVLLDGNRDWILGCS